MIKIRLHSEIEIQDFKILNNCCVSGVVFISTFGTDLFYILFKKFFNVCH